MKSADWIEALQRLPSERFAQAFELLYKEHAWSKLAPSKEAPENCIFHFWCAGQDEFGLFGSPSWSNSLDDFEHEISFSDFFEGWDVWKDKMGEAVVAAQNKHAGRRNAHLRRADQFEYENLRERFTGPTYERYKKLRDIYEPLYLREGASE